MLVFVLSLWRESKNGTCDVCEHPKTLRAPFSLPSLFYPPVSVVVWSLCSTRDENVKFSHSINHWIKCDSYSTLQQPRLTKVLHDTRDKRLDREKSTSFNRCRSARKHCSRERVPHFRTGHFGSSKLSNPTNSHFIVCLRKFHSVHLNLHTNIWLKLYFLSLQSRSPFRPFGSNRSMMRMNMNMSMMSIKSD